MGREVEKKYLVRSDGWRKRVKTGTPYRQGYLCMDPGRSVRVRAAGDRGFLTVKGKSEGAGRDEFEYPIPVDDAEQMLRTLCVQPLIEKTRYIIPAGDLKWEIDEFEGQNKGLLLAEIELSEGSREPEKPDWAGEEVTGDPRYYNLELVRRPYSQWRD